jgi:DNA-directed RNA polymerase specialized sigma24 family protein
LTANQRQVITMAYYDELSQVEIAEQTGRSLGTVKGLTRAALKQLRRYFEQPRVKAGQLSQPRPLCRRIG